MAYLDDLYAEKKKCEDFIQEAKLVANKVDEAVTYLGKINSIHASAYSVNDNRADDNYVQRLYQSEKKISSNITSTLIPAAQLKLEEIKGKIWQEEELIRKLQAQNNGGTDGQN